MKRAYVRLKTLTINNVKNVENGVVEIDKININNSEKDNSILGIYGQNGSGKTAVVDAMNMLQLFMKGDKLPKNIYKFIRFGEKEASLKFQFYIETDEKKFDMEYSFSIRIVSNNRIVLSNEKLYGAVCVNGQWESKKRILEYNIDEKEYLFKPNYRYSALVAKVDDLVQAKVAQEFTQGYDEENKVSTIYSLFFSKKMMPVYKNIEQYQDIYEIIQVLGEYARRDLIVIQNEHFGLIDMNISKIVFHVNMEEEKEQVVGLLPVNVGRKTVLPKELYSEFSKIIEQTNNVISVLVPEVTLEVGSIDTKYTDKGEAGISFELTTRRGESIIPLECESAGIKKLISICTALISCYNRPSVCLVIDEFDSGIFEFLLGQILEVMQENAQGQLIFTSHNLRALEVLDNDSLVFTTIEPSMRYSNLKYIKNTQNKRLSYLRAVYLGGQDIEFYRRTNEAKIIRAFRKSGR